MQVGLRGPYYLQPHLAHVTTYKNIDSPFSLVKEVDSGVGEFNKIKLFEILAETMKKGPLGNTDPICA